MTERDALASTVEDAEDADTAEMEKLEELIDRVKVTPPGEARRALVLELAAAVTADARAADFADVHGGRDILLKSMDGAMRVGDEELMDAVGAAVAARSRCAEAADAFELMAVGGSQVGAASMRPPGVEVVRLHKAGADVHVHESSWSDAGLAWRIWGASRIMAHALDAAAHAERSSAMRGSGATSPSRFPGKTALAGKVDVPRGDERGVFLAEKNLTAEEPFLRVRGARVLELGAGCGLGGLAAAAVGAAEVVLTEGAPGALAALARSAEAASRGDAEERRADRGTDDTKEGACDVSVAFLDWRDDQAALERDAERRRTEEERFEKEKRSDSEVSLPRVGSGTSVLEIRATELRSDARDAAWVTSEKKPSSSDDDDDAARVDAIVPIETTRVASSFGARNWVHKLKGGTCALTALPHLDETRTFDLIIGSDLLYDSTHCAPLAACLARRLEKTQKARAHVVLAVRRGALIARLCVCARNRWGLRFEVRALEVFEEEREILAQHQGGHIAREETPGAEAWRVRGGETFASANAPLLFCSSRDDDDGDGGAEFSAGEDVADAFSRDDGRRVQSLESLDGLEGLEGLETEMAKLEGRVAMVSFRWFV